MKLRISENLWESLRSQLLDRTDVETAGLMLAETIETPSGAIGIIREAFALPDQAYRVRCLDQLSIDPIALNRLTRRARDHGWGVYTIHTHPGASEPWFSQADDQGDARLMPSLRCQMPCSPHGSLVLVESGDVVARAFRSQGSVEEVTLQVVGRTVWSSKSQAHSGEPWFARQVLALGADGQSRLRRLRVGVIGLGGIGSLVSMQLAHLGVGELVLIDGDTVNSSNLSRIVGAVPADVDLTLKVDVAARYAKALGFSRVETQGEHLDASHTTIAGSCDVLVSCVDRHIPRALLNRIAYRYYVPVIDLGTVFRVDKSGRMTSDAGRVVVIGPDRPCLSCWGHLDPHAIRIESMTPAEREGLVAEGYIDGADEAQPSVIGFNTFVAGAGVIEVMRLATAFAGVDSPPLRLAFSFAQGTVKRNALVRSGECRICGGAADAQRALRASAIGVGSGRSDRLASKTAED